MHDVKRNFDKILPIVMGKLNSDAFADLPHLTNYNRRRKRLAKVTEQLAQPWGQTLHPHEDTYIVGSVPIPVAHLAREYATTVCQEQFYTAPDKGYSASLEQYFIGYKLHLVVTLDGVYHRMDLSKASVYDSQYLKDITHSGLRDCMLLADKGYMSSQASKTFSTAMALTCKHR